MYSSFMLFVLQCIFIDEDYNAWRLLIFRFILILMIIKHKAKLKLIVKMVLNW